MRKNSLSPCLIFLRSVGLPLCLCFIGAIGFCAESINQLTEEDKAGGWKLLFDGKSTQGWHHFKSKTVRTNAWTIEDGWLHCLGKEGGGDIISDGEFDNFDLQWEWKNVPGGNSGLKYFVLEKRESPLGHEYQMIDDERNSDAKLAKGKRVTGSFYDVLKPERIDVAKKPGEINRSRVIVQGNHVEHWLNGAKVLDYSCDSEAFKTAVDQSKFKNTAGFGQKVMGHILLQDHHSEVWFRNIKIRQLPPQ